MKKTKYLVLLCDGMADNKIPELNDMSPMEAAYKPTMDALARYATIGTVQTVPPGMKPGSDPANLAVMSYDPSVYSNGRSPLEAASMGLEMRENTTAFRCNLLTISEGEEPYEEKTMIDHGADEITTEEADVLIKAVEEALSEENRHFYTGVSYRHCMLWDDAPSLPEFTPPHDILGQKIESYLPSIKDEEGNEVSPYLDIMKRSYEILNHHPINEDRRARGLHPANSLWIWSPGKKPALPDFGEKWGLKASVISAVDLIKGIALCANMESIDVEGATGNINTNYDGKAEAAIDAFKRGQDYVYIHIEAPDECGHRGEAENKKRSIELIDEKVLTPVYDYLRECGTPYKIMVLPDHTTPVSTRTHGSDPVPFLIYSSEVKTVGVNNFNEFTASEKKIKIEDGYRISELLFSGRVPGRSANSALKIIHDFFELFAISLIAVMLCMTFIARHSPVSGGSMEETLHTNDILLVSNIGYTPKTGDIVIVQEPREKEKPLVKRVIATGGQTMKINYNTWEIWVDGELIDSSYVKKEEGVAMRYWNYALPDETGVYEGEIPEGMMFVMGDNRQSSKDSRSFGFVDTRYIIGRVIVRLYPFGPV